MVDWKLRKLNYEDINDLFDWRSLVARRVKTKEYFKWEYLKSPYGPVETTVAYDKGKIIGQYSTQRFESFYFGEKINCGLVFDVATHPDYRRQGMFVAIGKKHLLEEGKQGIHFCNGFPNEVAVPGHKKVNWHFLYPLPLYKNDNLPKLDSSNKFIFVQIRKFDDEFNCFSEKFKYDIPIYLNRTREYLNWRFVDKPYIYKRYKIYDKKGELVSYIVTKVHENTLHLIDFLIPKDKVLYNDILEFIISKAKRLKINTISLFINKHQLFCKFLQTKGFKFTDSNRVYIVRANNEYLDKRILYDEKNHYITMGDSDVF